ncbi:MAG: fumarylacetoacetate hydrolase family protein [Fibrella sp.]|nr:fumarylacetoacetate hydrolase family protein [Armatimonadota bacterium]
MKIIRYRDNNGTTGYAAQKSDAAYRIIGDLFGEYEVSGTTVEVTKILSPIATPPAILGIGLNYREHAAESGANVPEYPILFFKSPGTVQNPGDPIRLPTHLVSDSVDYECELAVVIGKPCRDVTPENALDYVFGYTCANDVSARDWQMKYGGSQWSRGKTFDTFCPLGPVIVTTDEIPDPNALAIRTILNGETVQSHTTVDMIFPVRELIAFLSADTTLLPGSIILTGTPQGVGMARTPPRYLRRGDTVVIEIEGIGRLENPVE